jgi:hypothetical protein
MSDHLLGMLEPSLVLQIDCNAGCPPAVTSHGDEKTRILGAFANCRRTKVTFCKSLTNYAADDVGGADAFRLAQAVASALRLG